MSMATKMRESRKLAMSRERDNLEREIFEALEELEALKREREALDLEALEIELEEILEAKPRDSKELEALEARQLELLRKREAMRSRSRRMARAS